MEARWAPRREEGFAIVESLLAATVLLVGLLGMGVMLTGAATATATSKAREQGVALQRELVEAARGIPYDQLQPGAVVGRAQSAVGTGLQDASSDAGWQIRRRGVTYTVTLGVCSVDDPADGTGTHDAQTFCASGAGGTSATQCATLLGVDGSVAGAGVTSAAGAAVGDCGLDLDLDGEVDGLTEAAVGLCILGTCTGSAATDATPDDYKRIVTLVRWDRGTGRRYALQSATSPNPGLPTAPGVSSLTTTAADPVTSGTSVALSATTARAAAATAAYVDGTYLAAGSGSGTSWTSSWPLGTVSSGSSPDSGEVLDGTYTVGMRAFDAYGVPSAIRAMTVRVNRRAPYAPQRFEAGRNGSVVEFEWAPSPERDVEGYRVYLRPSLGSDVLVCTLTTATRCQDPSPPSSVSVSYYVVAVDKTAAGALREGAASAIDSVGLTNSAPQPPTNLQLAKSGDHTVLTWTASPGDPDLGDAVDHYRILRDGVAFADRYDRTATGTETTFTDKATGGIQHTYRVVAVDGNLAESTVLGPVTG